MKMNILDVHFVKTSSDKVLGRADIQFDGFLLKGFKILFDSVKCKQYITPPSYKAGPFWRPLFKTDNLEDWQYIQREVLERFDKTQILEVLEDEKKA